MRRIVMFNRLTADGYFATADGGLDWAVPEPTLDQEAASRTGGVGTLLFGRRTYEMFERFWPRVLEEDAAAAPDPHAAARRSPAMRAMAEMLDASEKLVFSRTRRSVTWRNSRLVPELDPREIEALKAAPGLDIMIFGSGSLVTQLTTHGLIDEYQLIVAPIFLGGGRSLLQGLPERTPLKLVEAKAYPEGNVKLRYVRAS